MSVTTSPSTESPKNSRRSLVTVSPCSNANDRCVRAASRSLAAGVVPAVAAHPMGHLGLLALRTRAVRRRLRLPVRTSLRGAGFALLLLGDRHGGSFLVSRCPE